MVPKILFQEQKDGKRQIWNDILGRMKRKHAMKLGFFQYDPETKRQSIH